MAVMKKKMGAESEPRESLDPKKRQAMGKIDEVDEERLSQSPFAEAQVLYADKLIEAIKNSDAEKVALCFCKLMKLSEMVKDEY